jgi:tRNA (cytidine/uridine-2'-O-)-methyltransferase
MGRTIGAMAPQRVLFHVVMHEPEIPNNTGNIGRTCIATGCALHLIHPLGFDTGEKALRRAGLDYWPRLNVREHADWGAYVTATGATPERTWLTSGHTGVPLWEAELRMGDYLVFGKETRGLPEAMLAAHRARVLHLPMVPGERGLNVATAVCAVVYEGMRQCVARDEARIDADGRVVC